jgi:hypothetical protein
MSRSRGNAAPKVSTKASRRHAILDLGTIQRMLPLVKHVLEDIRQTRLDLSRVLLEKDLLDQGKRNLAWPARSRRYQLPEQISELEQRLHGALAELSELGVVLIDPARGQVDFPTRVNGRKAFFSWELGQEGIRSWHFDRESAQRSIPAIWFMEAAADPKANK